MIATEIMLEIEAGTTVAKKVENCGRQGDVLLARVPGTPNVGAKTDGTVIRGGSNGEHVIIAPSFDREGDLIHLAEGGYLVHTDCPEGRHDALDLPRGIYRMEAIREVGLDEAIRPVLD